MLHAIQLENILFLDIETVPELENFTDLPRFSRTFCSQNTVPTKRRIYTRRILRKSWNLGRIRKNNLYFSWLFYPEKWRTTI